MFAFLRNYLMMQKNAGVLSVVCILLCFTFNYTFPLHRESAKWSLIRISGNRTQICEKPTSENSAIERTKKGVPDLEGKLKKIKHSQTQDLTNNIYDHVNSGMKCSADKNVLSDDDLRHYEQLVIMKKYPYLDLKELELNMKYSPSSSKNVRQSLKSDGGSFANDPSICEPSDEAPTVEIINRGLSGFAIPTKLKNVKTYDDVTKNTKFTKKYSDQTIIKSLNDDIKEYVENLIK